MPFKNPVPSREYFRQLQVKYRRRREGKTDYYARRRLIVQDKNKYDTPKYRLVVRFTNKDIICQVIYAKVQGDFVLCTAYAHELPKFGLKVGLTNYAAAYCTGLLLARRILKKLGLDADYQGVSEVTGRMYHVQAEGERRPFRCNLDIGLAFTTTGNRVFAALKGAVDGGLDIPHTNRRFYGFVDGRFNAEMMRERIMGEHVSSYMEELKEEDEEAFNKQFGAYIKNGVKPEEMVGMYERVHAAIRASPEAEPKKESTGTPKDYSTERMSYAQRKDRIRQKKECRAWKLMQELQQ